MIVVVPFASPDKVQPWAQAANRLALQQDGIDARFEFMAGDDSYYGLMADLWARRETFVIVEHDIVVWPGAIQALENCPEPWCTYPYYSSVGWILDGLGCTKFGAELLKRFPDYLLEPFPDCCRHTRFYCGLDRLIAHRAEQLGLKPHVHSPGVVNLNERWT